jgi:hypothetical protein
MNLAFDMETVAKEMLTAAEGVFSEDWPKVKAGMEQVLADEQEALAQIAKAFRSGGLSEAEFQEQLDSEREVLAAGMAMVSVGSKATIQRAVNAALGVLGEAVRAVV